MVVICASDRTIVALKKNGAKTKKIGIRKHAVTFTGDIKDEEIKGEKAVLKAVVPKSSHQKAHSTTILAKAGIVGQAKSRAALMEEAKKQGIKYFRILSKQELTEIMAGAKPERIAELQNQAQARWKAGWGKQGKRGGN